MRAPAPEDLPGRVVVADQAVNVPATIVVRIFHDAGDGRGDGDGLEKVMEEVARKAFVDPTSPDADLPFVPGRWRGASLALRIIKRYRRGSGARLTFLSGIRRPAVFVRMMDCVSAIARPQKRCRRGDLPLPLVAERFIGAVLKHRVLP